MTTNDTSELGKASADAGTQGDPFAEEFEVGGDERKLIDPGTYFGFCYGAKVVPLFKFGAAGRVFLYFKIWKTLDDCTAGKEPVGNLYFVAAVPGEWDQKNRKFIKRKIGKGSRLFHAYCVANGVPDRLDRITLRAFSKKLFKVFVRTVKPRFQDHSEKGEPFQYSVVDELMERIA
jgi:hypothetical protein